MTARTIPAWLRSWRFAALEVGALAAATLLVAAIETQYGVPNASTVYLVAVVAVAVGFGTGAAIVTAVASFLVYDVGFVPPHGTLTVNDPTEWVNLVLLLVVGAVVGQLAGAQRSRAEAAVAREREARALFAVSRALGAPAAARDALTTVVREVADATRMSRIWIALGDTSGHEEIAAETAPGARAPAIHAVLAPTPANAGEWRLVHVSGAPRAKAGSRTRAYRVPVQGSRGQVGSLWAEREPDEGDPSESETRLLATTAHQVGQALERDRLAREAMGAEVARRSDALKSALLDSVSHDLRTPLASIRASAGALMDPSIFWTPDEQRTYARTIDREAERLNAFVSNLLDLSRIEAGDLRVEREVHLLGDLVAAVVGRHREELGERPLTVEVPDELAPVEVDPVLVEHVLANLLENAVAHTSPGARVRITACGAPGRPVRLTVEDGGAGVPADALPRLFDKFYRVPGRREGSRPGTGIGLAVVRGMAEAMGGTTAARRSELGGLAIDVELPVATPGAPPSDPRRTAP